MEEKYKALLKWMNTYFKPLGYKKEGDDFRLIQKDGLAKIVNVQKSLRDDKGNCTFTINAGIYFEIGTRIGNKKFEEYDCLIREWPTCISKEYGKDRWWLISSQTNMETLNEKLEMFLNNEVIPFLEIFKERNQVIEMILDGTAQQYTNMPVMRYPMARILVDMGYGKRVLPYIQDIEEIKFKKLVKEICDE